MFLNGVLKPAPLLLTALEEGEMDALIQPLVPCSETLAATLAGEPHPHSTFIPGRRARLPVPPPPLGTGSDNNNRELRFPQVV